MRLREPSLPKPRHYPSYFKPGGLPDGDGRTTLTPETVNGVQPHVERSGQATSVHKYGGGPGVVIVGEHAFDGFGDKLAKLRARKRNE